MLTSVSCAFHFDRPVSQWSGWLQKASFSVFTPCRATSGRMESYCGRSSLWVTMATHPSHIGYWSILVIDRVIKHVSHGHKKWFQIHFSSLFSGVSLQTDIRVTSQSCSLSVCLSVQVRVHIQTLPWILTSTRWSKMAATWLNQTLLQQRCKDTNTLTLVLIKLFWI